MEGNFFESHWLDVVVFVVGLVLSLWLEKKYKATKYVGFISYIPSAWTSLGILGTFISIYISLAMLDFGSLEDINQLVSRVAPAFSTSIIGIVGAVFWSIRNKFLRHREDVNEGLVYLRAIRSIDDGITRMRDGVLEAARDMGREMVNAAGEEWRRSLREHIIAIEGALKEEKEVFANNSNELIASLNKVSFAHQESMLKLLQSYEKEAMAVKAECSEALGSMASAYSKQLETIVSENTSHLTDIDKTIRSAVEQAFHELSVEIVAASDSMKEVSSGMLKVHEAVQRTETSVKSAGESFAQAKSDVTSVCKEAQAVMNECKERIDVNGKKVEELLSTAAEVAAKIKDLVVGVAASVTRASQLVDRVDSKVRAPQSVKPQHRTQPPTEPKESDTIVEEGWLKKMFSSKKQ